MYTLLSLVVVSFLSDLQQFILDPWIDLDHGMQCQVCPTPPEAVILYAQYHRKARQLVKEHTKTFVNDF